jgi:hypothetical protein
MPQCGIDTLGNELFRVVAPDTGVGEADGRPSAKVKRLLLVEKAVSETPGCRSAW